MLCFALLLPFIPQAAYAAETDPTSPEASIDWNVYGLSLGVAVTEDESTAYYSRHDLNRGYVDEPAPNYSEDYYILLKTMDTDEEAPMEVYEAFWETYNSITISTSGELYNNIEISEITTADDGYHKYITITLTGETNAILTVSASAGQDDTFQTRLSVFYLPAQELTSDGTDYQFTATSSPAYFYINLRDSVTYQISALFNDDTAHGNIVIQDGSVLWNRWDDAPANIFTREHSGRLIVRVTTANDSQSGTITVTEEDLPPVPDQSSRLMYRTMSFDYSAKKWYEDVSIPLRDLSEFSMAPYEYEHIVIYYFYAEQDQLIGAYPVTVSSGSSLSVHTKVDRDENFYWELYSTGIGDTTLNIKVGETVYPHTVTIELPEYGFYSSQNRTGNSYLAGVPYYDTDDGVVWFMSEDGFTGEEANALVPSYEASGVVSGNVTTEVVERGSSGRYDLKLTLALPNDAGYTLEILCDGLSIGDAHVSNVSYGNALYLDGYTIGFGRRDNLNDFIIINVGDAVYAGTTNSAKDENAPFLSFGNYTIYAGVPKTDANDNTYYEADSEEVISLSVNSMQIDLLYGDSGMLSFSSTVCETSKSDFGTSVGAELFAKDGYAGYARLIANVTVRNTTTDNTVTGNISAIIEITRNEISSIQRPQNDTVDALNQYLASLAESITGTETYIVNLAPITYEGTINIPSYFTGETYLNLIGCTGNAEYTTLVGSVDLNGSFQVNITDVHFKAPNNTAAAIYDGGAGITNCSFTGYNIAIESSGRGMINTSGSVFINNNTAAKIDIRTLHTNMSRNTWNGNTFINNGTAVEILSLNSFISPYYFRIINSNFIHNTWDIDCSSGGTVYLYKNYYGWYPNRDGLQSGTAGSMADLDLPALLAATTETALDLIVSSRVAHIIYADSTTLITNPRWKYPVMNWWQHAVPIDTVFPSPDSSPTSLTSGEPEASYINILVADWEKETQIVNEDAADLLIDISAFNESGEKSIGVVDQNSTIIGTWTFADPAQQPAIAMFGTRIGEEPSGSFHAGLAIDRTVNDRITVTVTDSAVLTAKTPYLSIPCDSAHASVSFNGTPIDCELAEGQVTFAVAEAGTYTISTTGPTFSYDNTTHTLTLANVADLNIVLAVYEGGRMSYVEVFSTDTTFVIPSGFSDATLRLFFLKGNSWMPICDAQDLS